MSTLTVADISLESDSPAQRLRRTAAAVRVSLHWWGVHRALTTQQKEELGAAAPQTTSGSTLEDVERNYILRVFRESNGVISAAADRLGVPRTTLNAMLKKLQISRSDL